MLPALQRLHLTLSKERKIQEQKQGIAVAGEHEKPAKASDETKTFRPPPLRKSILEILLKELITVTSATMRDANAIAKYEQATGMYGEKLNLNVKPQEIPFVPRAKTLNPLHPVAEPLVLVLTPTRELAEQVAEHTRLYSKYIDGVKIIEIYGGVSDAGQVRDLFILFITLPSCKD
jgi:hypothetical protein